MQRPHPRLLVFLIAVLALGLAGLGFAAGVWAAGPFDRGSGGPLAALLGRAAASPAPGGSAPSSVNQAGTLGLPKVGQARAAGTVVPPTVSPPARLALPPTPASIPQDTSTESAVIEAIYARVNPSVVTIFNLAHSQDLPTTADPVPAAEGSGFVWDTQGHIVTNQHVIQDAEKLRVTFPDGTELDATLVGSDPDSDLAVIKVDPSLVTLLPIEQGNVDDVKPGQKALALGNPFGFAGTMTQGIVSAVGRSIPAVTGFEIPESIQTDAAINPGNSGGPLLDIQGRVIGINAQIRSQTRSNTGVGFAIPINIMQRVIPALINTGHYTHPYLGIQGGTYTRAWSDALGLPPDARGAYIYDAISGGPAARAGLRGGRAETRVILDMDATGVPIYLKKGGDLITAIGGKPITSMDDVLIWLERYGSPDQTVQISVLRADGKPATISVKLSARPQQKTS